MSELGFLSVTKNNVSLRKENDLCTYDLKMNKTYFKVGIEII